jgi:hypothetical protein
MFFRREKPRTLTFEDRIAGLKQFGFESLRQAVDRVRVTRGDCGAMVESRSGGQLGIGKAGVLMGEEIAMLVSRGFQMFLRTPSGLEAPALARHLKELHAFDEDLREGLGLTSLYNLSLGTTSDEHLYDRIVDRDRGAAARVWDKKPV